MAKNKNGARVDVRDLMTNELTDVSDRFDAENWVGHVVMFIGNTRKKFKGENGMYDSIVSEQVVAFARDTSGDELKVVDTWSDVRTSRFLLRARLQASKPIQVGKVYQMSKQSVKRGSREDLAEVDGDVYQKLMQWAADHIRVVGGKFVLVGLYDDEVADDDD